MQFNIPYVNDVFRTEPSETLLPDYSTFTSSLSSCVSGVSSPRLHSSCCSPIPSATYPLSSTGTSPSSQQEQRDFNFLLPFLSSISSLVRLSNAVPNDPAAYSLRAHTTRGAELISARVDDILSALQVIAEPVATKWKNDDKRFRKSSGISCSSGRENDYSNNADRDDLALFDKFQEYEDILQTKAECALKKHFESKDTTISTTTAVSSTTCNTCSTMTSSWSSPRLSSSFSSSSSSVSFHRSAFKPQIKSLHLTENMSSIFVPRLTSKPYGREPLPPQIGVAQHEKAACASWPSRKQAKQAASCLAVHPYRAEIDALQYRTGPDESSVELWLVPENKRLTVITKQPVRKSRNLASTELVWVSTNDELNTMIQEIEQDSAGLLGVDLEAHRWNSYRGFTCLVQLSTRSKDWLVDPFELFDELCALNRVFANPSILKIIHGSDNDIHWLQRDFSVYVVNLFDTFRASVELETPGGGSLKNLLSHYLQIHTDKKYQTADWRIRPLSAPMMNYARCDSHYLIELCEVMTQRLLQQGTRGFHSALTQSKLVSAKVYTYPEFNPREIARKVKAQGTVSSFSQQQNDALESLICWRDLEARESDKSPMVVLSPYQLLAIVQKLPTTTVQLLNCLRPPPLVVRRHSSKILKAIKMALKGSRYTHPFDMTDEKPTETKNKNTLKKLGLVAVTEEKSGKPRIDCPWCCNDERCSCEDVPVVISQPVKRATSRKSVPR